MDKIAALEAMARELLEAECANQEHDEWAGLGATCPAAWIISDLVALVAEFHDRPVQNLAPMIRRILAEQNFVDENGDNVVDDRVAEQIDCHMEIILHVLERVRRHALEAGHWCNVPTPELTFG